MKHLFLYAIAFLFLCTACFETEEIEKKSEIEKLNETEETDNTHSLPPKVNILECKYIKSFIDSKQSQPPTDPRPSLKKYMKGDEYIYETYTGASVNHSLVVTAYWDSNCELICSDAPSCFSGEHYCRTSFIDSLVYIETIWNRGDTL